MKTRRIRRWVEERNGWPASVASTREGGDEQGLVRLHQETLAAGGKSHFNELVRRETAKADDSSQWTTARGARGWARRAPGERRVLRAVD